MKRKSIVDNEKQEKTAHKETGNHVLEKLKLGNKVNLAMKAFKSKVNQNNQGDALGQVPGTADDNQSDKLSGSAEDDDYDDEDYFYDENREKIESIQVDMRELNGKVNYMMKLLEQLANQA